eukprot:CAMPEP_0113498140 /NCGR_PEP_ID=MMETSP0014_2-20120614/30997_1 /TAXON_ID=2857 /ORGANISM="Nitzschia sp." /LENGTH=84 /DNA_ID=CAMNT_0000392111 /DNA_START=564 /DNA_END=818 /DNA_ORIENTATION=+ /assembly_acc=CAM_ASM_000159
MYHNLCLVDPASTFRGGVRCCTITTVKVLVIMTLTIWNEESWEKTWKVRPTIPCRTEEKDQRSGMYILENVGENMMDALHHLFL